MKEKTKDQLIRDGQYRKGMSIAYFNSLNAAIELAKKLDKISREDLKVFISEWRDWFLDEHAEYYGKVIAKIGVPYDIKESIKKLQVTENYKDLNTAWRNLSEDERHDPKILNAAKIEQKKYKV